MKYILFTLSLLFSGINAYSQVIINDITITAPPAPAGTSNPVNLSAGSLEYQAESEITLTENFEVQKNATPGTNYFLARIVGEAPVAASYAKLSKELSGAIYYTLSGQLTFKFDEEYYVPASKNLQFTIYDKANLAVTGLTAPSNFVTYGDNRFGLNVSSLTLGQYYVLEVRNEKSEKWYLRFKVN